MGKRSLVKFLDFLGYIRNHDIFEQEPKKLGSVFATVP